MVFVWYAGALDMFKNDLPPLLWVQVCQVLPVPQQQLHSLILG